MTSATFSVKTWSAVPRWWSVFRVHSESISAHTCRFHSKMFPSSSLIYASAVSASEEQQAVQTFWKASLHIIIHLYMWAESWPLSLPGLLPALLRLSRTLDNDSFWEMMDCVVAPLSSSFRVFGGPRCRGLCLEVLCLELRSSSDKTERTPGGICMCVTTGWLSLQWRLKLLP